jgi:hypothetical protein
MATPTAQRRWRQALFPLLAASLALVIYGATVAPDLTWSNYGADGGELITASVTLGVPHPPGYPTYVLLGKLFSYLPLGTVAFRFNLLSAVAATVAAGFITAASGQAGRRKQPTDVAMTSQERSASKWRGWGSSLPVMAAGLSYAFAPAIWGQATIAEVYSVNLACLAVLLWALLGRKGAGLTGILLGLSLTTHLTSLLVAPLVLWHTPAHSWPRLAAGLAVGLTPLLALPLLAQSASPIVWGRPETEAGWWWLVSGALYRSNVVGLPADEWLPRLAEWLAPALRQWTLAGWLLAAAGLIRPGADRPIRLALALTAALYAGYSLTYASEDAFVFALPALLLLTPMLGAGLRFLGPAALFLPIALVALNYPARNLGGSSSARAQITPLLQEEEVPLEAIVLSAGRTTPALWYFLFVEGLRADIIVADVNLFQFDWYRERLGERYPELEHLAADDVAGFVAQNRLARPVCHLDLDAPTRRACVEARP